MGEGEGQFDPPCGFSKNVSSKERVNPWLFVAFDIIINEIFPEHFIEIPQVVQKLRTITILAIFIDFHQFSGVFDISLLQKKLMTSAYNRRCQHFFTFNIL